MKNSNVLFVQFILKTVLHHRTSPLENTSYVYGLANGFSDTYDLCKSKGDFYWVDLNIGNRIKSARATINHCDGIEFPIDKGTAYVSCVLMPHVYQVYSWALRYPNVNFIAGGNVVDSDKLYWDKSKLPPNFKIYEYSVEDYFDVPNYSLKWYIDPPKELLNNSEHPIFFTYNLNNNCYWGKCSFCQYYASRTRVRENYNFEFDEIFPENDVYKLICLYSPSISSVELNKALPNLPDRADLFYRMYIRGTQSESITMAECFNNNSHLRPHLFEPFVGVEFPSKRMLKIIRKGLSVEEMVDSINRLGSLGTKVTVGLILGWPDLEESDLNGLELFLQKIKESTNISIKINKLFCRTYTKAHDIYKPKGPWKVGPFYQGFNPVISKKVLELNDRAYDIIENSGIPLMSNYKMIRDIEKDPTLKYKLGNKMVGSEK